jgi:hypothetical protein
MDAPAPHPFAPLPLSPESTPKTHWARQLGNAAIGATVGGGATWFVLTYADPGPLGAIGLLVAFVVSIWLHVIVHEAGHAVAGLAGGLKPVAFGVGPLRMERTAHGWRWRRGGALAGISGFALLLPPADARPRRREQALYLLGGPLSNLLVGVPILLLSMAAPPGAWTVVGYAFGIAGIVLGVVNLVPFKTAGWLSDGAGLQLLHRDPEGAMAGFRVQQVVQSSMDGQRPRDWPASLMPDGPLPDPASDAPWAPADVLLRLSAAIDRGDAERARECAGWLAGRWPRAAPAERAGIALSMAVYAALMEDDLDLLRAWRALATGGLLDQTCHEAWLDAEIALREGRIEESRTLAATARAALPRVHDGGTRKAVAERLDALAGRLSGVV